MFHIQRNCFLMNLIPSCYNKLLQCNDIPKYLMLLTHMNVLRHAKWSACGPGSAVGIETGYRLDSPGLESRWGEIFHTCPDWPWGPSLLYNGYRVFPGGKEWPRCDADPSPPSRAMVIKEQSYISTPPMCRTACTELQCLYKDDLYLF
jgi:hypothetical protein